MRPNPPEVRHPGYHYEPCEERTLWRVLAPTITKQCRFMRARVMCGQPGVAQLLRGYNKPTWYTYCEDHLYGRWIENGRIMFWRLVPDE